MTGIVGPWRPVHLLSVPLAAERPLCPHEDYIYHIFPIVRLHGKPSIIFSKRELERERIKGDQFFSRATAYEKHFRCRAQAHSAIFFIWNAITLEL